MTDRVVLITGASSGIGAALARDLAGRGASLALVARRAPELQAVAAACGPNTLAIAADVTSRADAERMVREAIARFGRLDTLVNNVGQGITRAPSELTDEDIDRMMLVNVKSSLYAIQAALPHFKARGSGHVINVSSMLGRMPFADPALGVLRRQALPERADGDAPRRSPADASRIQFSIVSPGVVHTGFGLNAVHGGVDSRKIPDGQTPEEVAAVIADVVETRRPDVYTRPGSRERVAAYYSAIAEDP